MIYGAQESFKAKMRAISKEKNRDPADLWRTLVLERFLVRLEKSPYSKCFVLKGGILLSKYIALGRETFDLDFLAQKLKNETDNLKNIFEKIAQINLNDGFSFGEVQAQELDHPHMGYPGIQVSMMSSFGTTRFKVIIDIGFGDVVDPVNQEIPLISSSKGSLFETSIVLPCYPKEFIFAEKLETTISRGSNNSRMKDFQDMYSLLQVSQPTSFQQMSVVIRSVFKNRDTQLNLPIFFDEEKLPILEQFWRNYLRKLAPQHKSILPRSLSEVISYINNWLQTNTDLVQNSSSRNGSDRSIQIV